MDIRSLLAALLIGAFCAGAGCMRAMNPEDVSDPGITARVKAELKAHKEIDVQYLDVSTNMGVVTISGLTESPETKRRINKLVRRIPGVKQLLLNLLIQE
ncbi:MAG: BON domain-containing protein [Elusimicrobia bacterium]|nr:BON domain-containing protein [Elusimicrobiota bacterium]